MTMTDTEDERVWENGWEGHEAAQLRRLARLSFGEKLQWLEEGERVARRLLDAPRRAPPALEPVTERSK